MCIRSSQLSGNPGGLFAGMTFAQNLELGSLKREPDMG
jgi:hypothetical protein